MSRMIQWEVSDERGDVVWVDPGALGVGTI